MSSFTKQMNKDGTSTTTHISATTLFDSSNGLTKAANHVTDKTAGTTLNGLEQSASGTNFLGSMQSLERIITAIPK